MRRVYSHSRRGTLSKCPRKYFYEVYAGSFVPPVSGGQATFFDEEQLPYDRITKADSDAAKQLKNLSGAYQMAGLILHDLIDTEWNHPDWSTPWFIEQATKRFDERVSRSENRLEGSVVLLEHYHGLFDASATIADARSRLELAMNNYMTDADVRAYVAGLRESAVVLHEQPIGRLPKIRNFTIMGRVDLACRNESGVRIVDWKMGKSIGDEDSLQLAIYGWWATKKFAVSAEQVTVQRVFLGDGTIEDETRMNERLLQRTRARLLQDSELMDDLHIYGEMGVAEAFPPCNQEKVCHQCNFQSICPAVPCATV